MHLIADRLVEAGDVNEETIPIPVFVYAGRTEDDTALLTIGRVVDVEITVRGVRTEGPGFSVGKTHHGNDHAGGVQFLADRNTPCGGRTEIAGRHIARGPADTGIIAVAVLPVVDVHRLIGALVSGNRAEACHAHRRIQNPAAVAERAEIVRVAVVHPTGKDRPFEAVFAPGGPRNIRML